MNQLMEMHRMSELAAKDLCVSMWPAEPILDTYFGLIQKLREVPLWIDAMKRSACLEGRGLHLRRPWCIGRRLIQWTWTLVLRPREKSIPALSNNLHK